MESIFSAVNILAVLVGAAIFVLAYAILVPKRKGSLGHVNSSIAREGEQGIKMLKTLGSDIYAILPETTKETKHDDTLLKNLIQRAGNPWGVSPAEFRFLRYVTLLIGALVGAGAWLVVLLLGYTVPWWAIAAAGAVLGFFFPDITHKEKANERDIEFKRELPEALDLISLTVASGKTFEQSLREIVPHLRDSSLKTELATVVQSINSGKTLRSSLDDLAERVPSSGITTFIRSIQESAELNVSMEEILESRATESREELFALIREKTATLPNKMTTALSLPLSFALLVLVLAPSLTSLVGALGA